MRENLKKYCQLNHLPSWYPGGTFQYPAEVYKYTPVPESPEQPAGPSNREGPNITQQSRGATGPSTSHQFNPPEHLRSSVGNPNGPWNPQNSASSSSHEGPSTSHQFNHPERPWNSQHVSSRTDYDTPGRLAVEMWGNEAISYVPLGDTVAMTFRPGYTPEGEKIIYQWKMGVAVYFVVHSERGCRLVDSGSAGGALAREYAGMENIPAILSTEKAVTYIRDRVNTLRGNLGTQPFHFGIQWVAMNKLDLNQKVKMPLTAVGFKSGLDERTAETVGIPRTALEKVFGRKVADRLVSKYLSPAANVPMRAALAYQYLQAGADKDLLRPLIEPSKVTQEQKLIEGLQRLMIKSDKDFNRVTSAVGLIRTDRQIGWEK
ncbi:hypothetical protein BDW74DRAFT_163579 [Aspergillus multicolor]|uniref:putative glutamine rich protein n=1 Tax=Aspergillus multicolor TaxID=41759 RepID=UPI003CCDC964